MSVSQDNLIGKSNIMVMDATAIVDDSPAAASSASKRVSEQSGLLELVVLWCWLFLDAIEDRFTRMNLGIWRFITSSFPQFFMRLYRGIVRVTCKLARVLVFALIWAGITFGPGIFLVRGPWLLVLLGLVWTGFALIGSVYGLIYLRRRI